MLLAPRIVETCCRAANRLRAPGGTGADAHEYEGDIGCPTASELHRWAMGVKVRTPSERSISDVMVRVAEDGIFVIFSTSLGR